MRMKQLIIRLYFDRITKILLRDFNKKNTFQENFVGPHRIQRSYRNNNNFLALEGNAENKTPINLQISKSYKVPQERFKD